MGTATNLAHRINVNILNPLIGILFGVALIVFLWGIATFIMQSDSDQQREMGKKHMLWGLVGMLIMVSFLAIMRIIANTIGVAVPSSI